MEGLKWLWLGVSAAWMLHLLYVVAISSGHKELQRLVDSVRTRLRTVSTD